mmetsp:Transcript_153429/g.268284  ORF Transcript_153429/g.268284 Transcript_153429/m.268284 type:complete len:81 (+) Transcript_153429:1357-1599(+)
MVTTLSCSEAGGSLLGTGPLAVRDLGTSSTLAAREARNTVDKGWGLGGVVAADLQVSGLTEGFNGPQWSHLRLHLVGKPA